MQKGLINPKHLPLIWAFMLTSIRKNPIPVLTGKMPEDLEESILNHLSKEVAHDQELKWINESDMEDFLETSREEILEMVDDILEDHRDPDVEIISEGGNKFRVEVEESNNKRTKDEYVPTSFFDNALKQQGLL